MSHLHIDFETRSVINLKTQGLDVYANHPTTAALCFGYAFDDEPVEMWKRGEQLPIDVATAVADGITVVAHNAGFELAIWNKVLGTHIEMKPSQVLCTQAMAYAMALPGSLEMAAPAAGITQQKDMAGSRVMMQLCQPRDIKNDGTIVWWEESEFPEKYQRLYAYCKQDLEVERELFKRLLPLSPAEREMWQLDYQINQRGILVDLPAVENAIRLVEYEKNRLDSDMRMVTDNAVATCNSTQSLKDWLRFRGVEIESVAKSDVVDLLATDTLPADCRRALLLRQEAAKSSTAKLEAMKNRAGTDGRLRGLFQYHGAGTGRWAGRGVQVQNLPRQKMENEELGQVFEILKSIGA